jgi:UDP-2,3-diacylglucosamine pyrophosphatase LpxH
MKNSNKLISALLASALLFVLFVFVVIPTSSSASPISTKLLSTSANSFSINVTSTLQGKAYVEYGYAKSKYTDKTTTLALAKGVATTFVINGLKAETKVYYRVRYALNGKTTFSALTQTSITTSKVGEDFVFAVQADPHMDQASSAEVYTATINQIVKSKPAFLMDLGDIFMTDKLQDKSDASIRQRFELMKGFYDKLNGIPFYFTLGNHDGELGYSNFNTKKYRKEYFPAQTGELAYYSFSSPGALHIVLDIFTYTTTNPKDDGWQWTLGKTQYDWLKTTLENSTAQHKFVYVHHLLYGNAQSRGGVENAKYNEWGGKNRDGSEGFASNRPGWAKPVHQLLVENGVDFVFKGHDHIYVKQELDGIIYQTLPQPSHPGNKTSSAAEYGYVSGKTIGGSGFLKITTNSASIKVDFVRYDGSIADSYVKNS